MALAVDSEMATNTGFGVSGVNPATPASPQTFSFTNTAGTVLYMIVTLGVNTGGTTAFGTVSYNGVAMTNILNQTTASGASRIGIFRLLSPATGANTVSIAHTMVVAGANFSDITAGCISFTGNDTVTPEAQAAAGANGTSVTAAASLTGVAAGNITVGGAGGGSAFTGQSQTLSWAKNLSPNEQLGNGRCSRSASTGSVSHTFTLPSDQWAAVIVEVAAAGAATVLPPHPMVVDTAVARSTNY